MNKLNLRYGSFFRPLRIVTKYSLSLFYWPVIKIWKLPQVLTRDETIDDLILNNKSVVRYGDSEILYLMDKLNLPYQKYDPNLATILKEILKTNIANLIVGLPNAYISDQATARAHRIFWRSQIVWNYPRFSKYLLKNKIYGNASITRVYYGLNNRELSLRYFNKLKQLWDKRDVLMIEGEKTRFGIGNDLLENARSVRRILGPKHNSFSKFNELMEEAMKFERSTLVLVAMGPTAKAIVYKLSQIGYQAIDIGNLDIEYEWFLVGKNERVLVPGKYVSEVKGGREVADIPNREYEKQIVAKYVI